MIIKVLGALFLIAAGISVVGESGPIRSNPLWSTFRRQSRRGYRASPMPNPSQTRTAHERFRWKPIRTRLPAWSTCIGGIGSLRKQGW